MSLPRVVAAAPGSPAIRAGLAIGDEIVAINGEVPRDIIQYELLTDEADVDLTVSRGGLEFDLTVHKTAGEPLGLEVSSALFDQVRTCDNHCSFCFIYQLPKGLRRSLYVKDDDFRLSFLYGNFTTLTRFTEADLERVITEALSPLYVSIHATDPVMRAELLRNPRGATSLRWLRALLDNGIEVHGQVVVCPGINDGTVLEDTFCGVLDRFPELATVGVVPLGVSRYTTESTMRSHTSEEAAAVVDLVESWQAAFSAALGRRLVYAADEYYLLAGRAFPKVEVYDGFPQHENGIGMARSFAAEFSGEESADIPNGRGGFFASVDGAPADGYRGHRWEGPPPPASGLGTTAILTGAYGAQVLGPLLADRPDVRVVEVENRFFGGNIGVTGLLVGEDLSRALADQPPGDRYLLPDVCLSNGRFLDGTTPADLPRPVEVVATTGVALRDALAVRVGDRVAG